MTWIVAQPHTFGYATAVSDIRVTFSDGSERDCLQKIYDVGPTIMLGFAGSVAIGFAMVERLAELLQVDDPELGWEPDIVAQWWPTDARDVFESFPESERDSESHLIMIGAHPNQNIGDSDWPRCYAYRFRSPDFVAEEAQLREAIAIGCGEDVEEYRRLLGEIPNDFTLLKFEIGNPGGAAHGLMSWITDAIEREPVQGISPNLQICILRRQQIILGNNNREWFDAAGKPTTKRLNLKMPEIARSPAEFEQILCGSGCALAGAVC